MTVVAVLAVIVVVVVAATVLIAHGARHRRRPLEAVDGVELEPAIVRHLYDDTPPSSTVTRLYTGMEDARDETAAA